MASTIKIGLINGPNLNLLGKRQPEIYGSMGFEQYLEEQLRPAFPALELHYFQSNHEGALIDCVQTWGFDFQGLVLNAGGYTHSSVALADAVAAVPAPVVEVHISNIFAREAFRRQSFLSPYCKGIISGLGLQGYALAIQALLD